MRSTFSGLNTVTRGLFAQQMALDTVGHNVANASSDGYSRQRVNVAATFSQTIYAGSGPKQIGTGVSITSITRARDVLLDRQMWDESPTLSYGQTIQDNLGKIETIFGDPSDTGIQSILDSFWTAWSNLSTDGSNAANRSEVIQRGVQLADAVQTAKDQLWSTVDDINDVIDKRVGTVNQITAEILSLNKSISLQEMGGASNANDLRDRRDYLVDQLSGIINVNVREDSDGNYVVQTTGGVLVDGHNVNQLDIQKGPEATGQYNYEIYNVVFKDDPTKVINFSNGEIRGLMDVRDSDIYGVKGYLDKLAGVSKFLLEEFNDVHRGGIDLNGNTDINFFGTATENYNDATNFAAIFGTAAPANYQWINALQVNPALLAPSDGTSKVAARTQFGSLAITKSNYNGGDASLSGKFTGTLPLAAPLSYTVTISGVNADGRVTGVTCSVAGAVTQLTPDTGTADVFTLPNGVRIRIATDTDNIVGNTYTFTVDNDSFQGVAAGDNAVNLGNRLKTDISATIGSMSLDSYYQTSVGTLGVQKQNAKRLTDNQQTLVDQITNARESVSGVNMDEELSNMIRFQKGYSSIARVLTALDESYDKLINGTGVVGR
ncbi:MAG TPA: flagellar hook-associated protein FlgK [Methylomusa anaerophila]|uniref:Flagellar hook-associated protein 1 n=1 Tax=Methylomusa anaerophila TaxID=1930071 RepID=A0A348AKU3_9FIRM|nr:flagellar hook-associated protein FlgK [Methylomusa anaerophila]BBB91691.1 flagellar hook-associated protein 1 [Methylomusa anaerophila]HML88575.1 flagellar hook-associated protein FlgK [Methylomusa anaerophila]